MTDSVLKRPKAEDNEDDLLQMQEEFLKSNQAPAAKVINLNNVQKTKNIQSQFAKDKLAKAQENSLFTPVPSGNVVNPSVAESFVENSKKAVSEISPNIVLGNIIERKCDFKNPGCTSSTKILNNVKDTGFPKVFVSNNVKKADNNHSLFWEGIFEDKKSPKILSNNTNLDETANESSVIIEGSWASEIHNENMQKLNNMSKEEILKEKENLENTLDEGLIEFLRKRRANVKHFEHCQHNKECGEKSENVNIEEIDEKMDHSDSLTDAVVPNELIQEAKQKGWLHMDNIEVEKLKWTEDLKLNEKNQAYPNEPYNARFDFNGLLLPYKDETVTVDKGLHHHGEEPERPGYSLQELLQLSRSSTQQQRITALTTLANIIKNSRKGYYDRILEPAPLPALSKRNILLLLRFSLDDTSVGVVTATLQALRAFLYCEEDEICLDRLYGLNNYTEPFLMPELMDVKDTNELKDHELVQLDAVAAILRSDIVLRLRYILSEMRLPPIGVTAALEILIRLCRHSRISAMNVANTPNLLNIIVKYFIPLSTNQLAIHRHIDNAYGIPVVAALKLCRVLVMYAGRSVAEKLVRLKIIHRILSYITSDAGKYSIDLSIEALRLWKLLLDYKLALDSITGAQLALISQLQLFLSNHDIGNSSELKCEHAAAFIAVARSEPSFKTNISVLMKKWITQLSSTTAPTWSSTKLIAETLIETDVSCFKTNWLRNASIFSSLCSTSNLLSDCISATDRDPSCLPSLGVLTRNGKLQPLVSNGSCILFLETVAKMFCDHSLILEMQALLNQPELCEYLIRLENSEWNLESSWYTRTELMFLTSVVKMGSILGDSLGSAKHKLIWKISVKLISALPADLPIKVREVLHLALSGEKLKLEAVMNGMTRLKLHTSAFPDVCRASLKYDTRSLYARYVTYSERWNQTAMPKDWLYLPLVHVYTNYKSNGLCSEQSMDNIIVALSLEVMLPELVEKLPPSLRFSRLVLVYLCDTVYLNKDISDLLTQAFSNLLQQYYESFDFTSDLPGLSSFTDLFTAMCEHFCSSSYGNGGFSMILLVPIAQRHDVHYRKLLWSEHASALRYLALPLEDLLIPINEYLYPEEEDISLIESYLTSLVRGTVKNEWCPVPYLIAIHHSAMYLKRATALASRMRTQIEKIRDKGLADSLLNYVPNVLYQ